MGLERQQILSLFIKAMKKFSKYLNNLDAKEIESSMPRLKEVSSVGFFYYYFIKYIVIFSVSSLCQYPWMSSESFSG